MQMCWADVIFGLVEGWWLFEDGQKHVLQNTKSWTSDMNSSGFRHADWTDGRWAEANSQKPIFAMASDIGYVHTPLLISLLSGDVGVC